MGRAAATAASKSVLSATIREVVRTETDIHGSLVEDVVDAGIYSSRECAADALMGRIARDPYADAVAR